MLTQIQLGDITVDVVLKDIKNIHLSVYPPTGRVRISAPSGMNLETIRVYAISRLGWIKKQQNRFYQQKRESPREFISRESHYFLGKRYLLKITENDSPSTVVLRHREIELIVRPGTSTEQRKAVLDNWYRKRLKQESAKYLAKWSREMNVTVDAFGVKRMRTKWGSCIRESARIWINLELAKKPAECIEYVIVHELVHLLERHHNQRFISHMDHYLPGWRQFKDQLNRLPISHVNWDY